MPFEFFWPLRVPFSDVLRKVAAKREGLSLTLEEEVDSCAYHDRNQSVEGNWKIRHVVLACA